MLCLSPPYEYPVRFKDIPYIRIDNSLHPLSHHPAKEAAIWQEVSRHSFENSIAKRNIDKYAIDKNFFVEGLVLGLATGRRDGDSLGYLEQEGLIETNLESGYDIKNLFVLVAARNFSEWAGFERKGIRLVVFKGRAKINTLSDIIGKRGYFAGFENALREIMKSVPHREELQHGIRKTIFDIPEDSIREILANAIVHQNLLDTSKGPLVEIFNDRIVITNPGKPLIRTDRFIDAPSTSRNSALTDIMRRLGVCEARGSGIDKAFTEIEKVGLPPPDIRVVEDNTVVTLYGPKSFADLTKEERLRACYWHACLCVERNDKMSNSSLRHRFKLNTKQYPQVSEVIRDAIDEELIRPLSEDQANRNARYVPFWF